MGPEAGTDHKSVQPRPELVIFVGREGTGKTQQSIRYAQAVGLPHIGTGQMIREMAASQGDGPLFDACVRSVANTTYLEPEFLSPLLGETVARAQYDNGAVIDGALRTLQETEDFDQTLANAGRQDFNVRVLSIRVPLWLAASRTLARGEERDSLKGFLTRLGEFSKDLGERMKIIRERYYFRQVDGRGPKEDAILAEMDEDLRKQLIVESENEVYNRILEALAYN